MIDILPAGEKVTRNLRELAYLPTRVIRLQGMNPKNEPGLDSLADGVKTTWHRFVDVFEQIRPQLFRYCRALTRNAWDAEDPVQDTLARSLVTLGCLFQPIENPRAWLFRVASNLWIDRQRRHREFAMAEPPEQLAPDVHTAETRDAALLTRISPQERAAILLKEAFDFTIDEIAQVLVTTPGAVKAALHRGREKLAAPARPEPHRVAQALLNAFCEAFNARDLERLVALMLETATAEIVGIGTEYGPDRMRRSDTGTLYHSLFSPISHAVDPSFLKGDRGLTPKIELRDIVANRLWWLGMNTTTGR